MLLADCCITPDSVYIIFVIQAYNLELLQLRHVCHCWFRNNIRCIMTLYLMFTIYVSKKLHSPD